MKLKFVPGALLLVVTPVISVPALAQDAAPSAKKPAEEKKICRRDEQAVGTRLAPRTCLTAEQWRQRGERAPAGARTMDNVERVSGDGQPGG
ncbi:MAG: hypothetical protein EOP58_05700 [Sphingomonadales bacterium]|nr:MAG: hypothetical protein EOP58_05700 [Sphingomonadales bacterium]